MLLGAIADDLTGATDLALTLSREGMKTVQVIGIPSPHFDFGDAEAVVVALKSRTIPAQEAVSQSCKAAAVLLDAGAEQIIFKYCSTFDSTPAGNIGPVGEALAHALDARGVVACPAFPGMKRTLYMGHLFVDDRPLHESGLENHPLNPMTDPDIRRWLARQCTDPVGLIAHPTVTAGAAAIRTALAAGAERGETLIVVDAVDDDDLVAIGHGAADAPLITGGSGIAIALPENFIARGEAAGTQAVARSVPGPEAILAGSCSSATLGQIEHHARAHPTRRVDADDIVRGEIDIASLAAFVHDNIGRAPLIYSSASAQERASAKGRHPSRDIASAIEDFFARLAALLVEEGVRRLVVAGGETSGAVVGVLQLGALEVGPEIDPGVPLLYGTRGSPIALALKSGNFGAPDFFAKALSMMERQA